jgi:IS1 family transposase
VIKRYAKRRLAAVERRVVRGTADAVATALVTTQGSPTAVVNTAYVERLNATFRARLAPLARRTRAGVHRAATLEAELWLAGTAYNFCCPHRSLRRRDPPGGRWLERTPAQTAGLVEQRWSLHELLAYPVPGAAPKRRGPGVGWLLDATRAA